MYAGRHRRSRKSIKRCRSEWDACPWHGPHAGINVAGDLNRPTEAQQNFYGVCLSGEAGFEA
jgi:hypothetical protein